jgi:hypothetical protein
LSQLYLQKRIFCILTELFKLFLDRESQKKIYNQAADLDPHESALFLEAASGAALNSKCKSFRGSK